MRNHIRVNDAELETNVFSIYKLNEYLLCLFLKNKYHYNAARNNMYKQHVICLGKSLNMKYDTTLSCAVTGVARNWGTGFFVLYQ